MYVKYSLFSRTCQVCSCCDAAELTHALLVWRAARTRTDARTRASRCSKEEKDPACYLRLKLLRQAQRNERQRIGRIVVGRESRATRQRGATRGEERGERREERDEREREREWDQRRTTKISRELRVETHRKRTNQKKKCRGLKATKQERKKRIINTLRRKLYERNFPRYPLPTILLYTTSATSSRLSSLLSSFLSRLLTAVCQPSTLPYFYSYEAERRGRQEVVVEVDGSALRPPRTPTKARIQAVSGEQVDTSGSNRCLGVIGIQAKPGRTFPFVENSMESYLSYNETSLLL